MTLLTYEDGQNVWRYKHPSIRDAFAQYVADDIELLEIYLTGSLLDKLFQEVACADIKISGLKVIVPESHFQLLISRLQSFNRSGWRNKKSFSDFLTKRCDHRFLSAYLKSNPDFLDSLKISRSILLDSDLEILTKYFEAGLLSDEQRNKTVQSLHELAINDLDTQFSRDNVKILLTQDEFLLIKSDVKDKIIVNLGEIIDDLSSDYDDESDPEDHFSDLSYSLGDYENIYLDDDEIFTHLSTAKGWVEDEVKELTKRIKPEHDETYDDETHSVSAHKTDRSIFDDVAN